MRRAHQLELHQAKGMIKVLPLDEAEKTLGEYNKKKFAGIQRGRFYAKLKLREGETGPAASSS
jgi:hypothetical protein